MAATPKEIFNDLNLVLRLNQHLEALTATEASAAALLQKESSFKVLAELSSIETPDTREHAQFEHQRADFGGAGVASTLPFHLQGDQAFNEASALARRRQLRHSEAVKSKIQFLWQVARGRNAVVELTHGTSSSSAVPRGTASPTATINEREYAEMMLLIFKVLRDDFVLETAQLQIQCDWEVDSHHGDALSYEQFFPALFELVDVWTCDILEATYARFLELLTRRITVRVVVFLDDMKLKLALSDNFDEAVVVKAIPLSTIKQFASVAKVMEGTGVRTVGQLASADPRVVEKQRMGYLDKNAFSSDKIGMDLEHLLRMFREISEQFQDANYVLRNMVLQRLPHGNASSGNPDRSERGDSFGSLARAGGLSLGHGSDVGRGTPTFDASRTGSGHELQSVGGAMDPWTGELSSSVGNQSPGMSGEGRRSMDGPVYSAAEADAILRRGGVKRISTFRDITVTETGVLDALKATFLIEKGISIQRKVSLDSIKAELVKFGVDPKGMDAAAIHEKYDRLYEMFVLRDGDNIKALASSILSRIKMELAAHGIDVNEDEMEAIYDVFYGRVVAGSGDRIVADAKSWVDETVRSNSYSAYIKQEYHELKSIDEVQLLGAGVEDEEFVSLLSKEDSDDEADEDGGDTFGKNAENPAVKAVASLSRRPSLYRGLSDSPKKDLELSERSLGVKKSLASLPIVENNNHNVGIAKDQPTLDSNESHIAKMRERAENLSNDVSTTALGQTDAENVVVIADGDAADPEVSDEILADHSAQTKKEDGDDMKQLNETGLGEVNEAKPDAECTLSETTDPEWIATSTSVVVEDDLNKRSSIVNLKPANSKANLLDGNHAARLDGNHGHLNEADREPQGVGYEYDEEDNLPSMEPAPVTADRPIVREPKIPDIVVGGTESGKNVAVTARYIQLLGLGNVETVMPESELMARLTSPMKESIDLVLYDVGVALDTAVAKAKEFVSLVGRRVIFFGGDERQPEKSDVIARLCVSEGGLLYFGMTPIDFPALRSEIQSFFDTTPELYLSRQRRVTGAFGAAARMVTSSIRASNMICIEDDHPRTVLTPPLSVDNSSPKRRASEKPTQLLAPTIPQGASSRREAVSPFRPLRLIDEMPGADVIPPKRYTPIVPVASTSRSKGKSPRMSAALKKLLR